MLRTVEEVAITLDVSRATIYNKLKNKSYKDKTTIKQGKTMIGEDLLNLIQLELSITNKHNNYIKKESHNIDTPIIKDDFVKLNQELVKSLIEQLADTKSLLKNANLLIKEKDAIITNQLNESNIRLKDQQELTRNGQVLQSQNIKYIELTEKMREEPIVKKGFMSKLFNK
jgi:transcriptional regulator of acetoin/glycerol metabolism